MTYIGDVYLSHNCQNLQISHHKEVWCEFFEIQNVGPDVELPEMLSKDAV